MPPRYGSQGASHKKKSLQGKSPLIAHDFYEDESQRKVATQAQVVKGPVKPSGSKLEG